MNHSAPPKFSLKANLKRRYQEYALISRDPVLLIGLLIIGIFISVFVFFPIGRVVLRGFFNKEGAFSLEYFQRYIDPYFRVKAWGTFWNSVKLGLMTATAGTTLGFIFAYAMVRCNPPGKKWVHIMALVPTVSPPFALAIASILLFGRNGLVTSSFLGMTFDGGRNDLYGMDGLVFVQTMSFFSVAYLIIRAMLERLNPSMEEAANSLGASRSHIFRTITLPLLIPGLAGSFLLLFVESLADLGNPLLLSGNVDVLSAQIFLAIAGEFDYQKASTLAFVLLIPTLIVFVVQRYWVGRRSYISVTGKPARGHIQVKEPLIRWSFIAITYAVIALIVVMYTSIIVGSFSTVWGIDFTPTTEHWRLMLGRGIEAILDTTFLSIIATPIAGILGIGIAFLVVRKKFSGKDFLDFGSNLGAGVPGTILGIGFILSFVTPPWIILVPLYIVLALFLSRTIFKETSNQLIVIVGGSLVAGALRLAQIVLGVEGIMILVGILYIIFALYFIKNKQKRTGRLLIGSGIFLLIGTLITPLLVQPLNRKTLRMEPGMLKDVLSQIPDYIKVLFQVPGPILAIIFVFFGVVALQATPKKNQRWLAIIFLGLGGGLCFVGEPFAMIGSAYIIIFAFAVRSLPASVRAGMAALQQIDPAIEEASNSLGANAEYTFRRVTVPLITPALLAGLIFSFTRHMTSLSAIIFLVSPRWRIVTASILSEWEQGGVSFAAAYATVIILLVLIAIGIMTFVTRRILHGRDDIDLSMGA